MKIIASLTIFWVMSLSWAFSQTIDLNLLLSKEQMYKDFDEFVQIIDSNPQILVRKIATGYDAGEQIRSRKYQIDSIKSHGEFLYFLNNCLGLTMSVHAQMASNYEWHPGAEYIDTSIVVPLYQVYKSEYTPKLPMDINSRSFPNGFYHNGNYYVPGKYTFFNRASSDTIFLSDIRLLEINDKPVDILKNSQMDKTSNWYRWDSQRQQYYCVYGYPAIQRDKLIIENYADKNRMNLDELKSWPRLYSTYSLPRDIIATLPEEESDNMKVTYYDNLHLLYIYMGTMAGDDGEFVEEIKRKGAGKQIDKIIWDVRDNYGGSDQVWMNVLSAIIKTPLPIKGCFSFKNTDLMREILKDLLGDSYRNIVTHRVPFLNDMEFLTYKNGGISADGDTICYMPDTNSLQYDGIIYLLQNEHVFSATGTLLANAKLYPQLISVGVPIGLIMGRGISPAIFQLPESKFTFIIEACIDLTDCETAIDVFHDKPEIEIYPTLDDIIDMHNYGQFLNKRGDQFLFNHDYLFKKVIKMNDER